MDNELVPVPDEGEEYRRKPILSREERRLLWWAICSAARQLNGHPEVYLKGAAVLPLRASDPSSGIKDWQLAEALTLLCVVLGVGRTKIQSVNLFKKVTAAPVTERGEWFHLWYQPQLVGHISNLLAKPDIAVTSRSDCSAVGANIRRVIEVKHIRQLQTPQVRQEFAKAFDLNVNSYCILTYFPTLPDIHLGANSLGLDVVEIFTNRPMEPAELVSHICNALKQSRNDERFAKIRFPGNQQQVKKG